MEDRYAILEHPRIFVHLLICIVVCLVLDLLWKNRKFYRLSWKLQGPFAWPIIGNCIQLGILNDVFQLSAHIYELSKTYKGIFRVWLGPELNVVFNEAEDFECILMDRRTANKGAKYDLASSVIGNGILTSSGHLWRTDRTILNPSFNSENVRNHLSAHNVHAEFMVEKMLEISDKGVVDISEYPLKFSIGTLAEFLYGMRENYQDDKFKDISSVGPGMVGCFFWRLGNPLWANDFLFSLTERGRKSQKLKKLQVEHFNSKFGPMCDSYVEEFRKNDGATVSDKDKRLRTPLEVMFEAHVQGRISKEQLQAESVSVFYPGVDSLYTVLCFFVLMLAIHGEHQDRVWEEIVEVMGDDYQGPVLFEHLARLKYMDMCFKEANRLFPTGAFFTRMAREDIYLKHRDLLIPSGTTILLSLHSLNRNPKHWEAPDAFNPERFLPEVASKRHSFAHVPFSAGLRSCIGKTIAMDAMKVAGVHLIRAMKFHCELKIEDVPLKADVSLRSTIGYPLMITKRNVKK